MLRKVIEALCFDDVLLVPKHYPASSRSEVNLATTVATIPLDIPIISANMPSVTEVEMAVELCKLGGLGVLHRMCSIEQEADMVSEVKYRLCNEKRNYVGASIGVGKDWRERTEELINRKVDIICLDVAHADQKDAFEVVTEYFKFYKTPIIIGNIGTVHAAISFKYLAQQLKFPLELLILKASIGSGANCSTRIATGCGIPTLQAIIDISPQHFVISDGGIKNSGDCVKSLAAGASACMLGSMLAGTAETPGEILYDQNRIPYKVFAGNASVQVKSSVGLKTEYIEGVARPVSLKGPLEKVVKQICDGIRSGFSYCGALDINMLHEKAEFIKVSPAGHLESKPHGLIHNI